MTARWMVPQARRWLWPVIAGLVFAAAAFSVAAAHPGGGDAEKRGKLGGAAVRCDELAELVGAEDCGALKAALADGQTLAAAAEANGVDPQTVIDSLAAQANERIDQAVESGKLSEAEAAEKRGSYTSTIETYVNEGGSKFGARSDHRKGRFHRGGFSKGGFGRGGHHKSTVPFGGCGAVAELVGAEDCGALKAALTDGQTLAAIAEANGIERQTVIDGLIAPLNTKVDEAAANGRLSEDAAANYRERLLERIAGMVDEGFSRLGGKYRRGQAEADRTDSAGYGKTGENVDA